jgi:hypothetical protein
MLVSTFSAVKCVIIEYMKLYPLLTMALVLMTTAPSVAFAAADIQNLIKGVVGFINGTVILFLVGITFLVLIFNIVRYFVVESANEDGREKAKNIALYSVAAFVFVIIFWGIVNMLTVSLGLEGTAAPCPDYLKGASGGC